MNSGTAFERDSKVDELLTMSNREITRLEVMQRLQEKRLSQKEAAGMLGMSTRQVKRLFRPYKTQGAQGLVSKRRGQPSHNRLDDELMQQVIDLIYKRPLYALREIVSTLSVDHEMADGRPILGCVAGVRPPHTPKSEPLATLS
jgi:transposase